MTKQVIILVADQAYTQHAKSLMVNCCLQGNYQGDFVVIHPSSISGMEWNSRGVHTLSVPSVSFAMKFHMFSDFFKRWDECLYLDCDCIVQDDLSRLFALLVDPCQHIWMDTEDCSTLETFWRDTEMQKNLNLYRDMIIEFPWVVKQTFNTSIVLFRSSTLEEHPPEALISIQKKYEPTNCFFRGGTDQQIINLLLWNKISKIPNKLVCFWGLAAPINEGPNPARGFVGGETPVAIHYSRWGAPWIKKDRTDLSLIVPNLKREGNEVYSTNLSKFDELFPVI